MSKVRDSYFPQMPSAGILRKDFTFGGNAETLRSWVSSHRDLEVRLVSEMGTFSLISFATYCLDPNCPGEDDTLIPVDFIEFYDEVKAEEHFLAYTSNFL